MMKFSYLWNSENKNNSQVVEFSQIVEIFKNILVMKMF